MKTLIVLVLAAVSLSCSRSIVESETAINTMLNGFRTALDAFEVDNGRYPTQEEGLQMLVSIPPGADLPNWKGPYLDKLPNDPWGHPFHYIVPAPNGYDYGVYSCGEDGVSRSNGNDWDDAGTWPKPHSWLSSFLERPGLPSIVAAVAVGLAAFRVYAARVSFKRIRA